MKIDSGALRSRLIGRSDALAEAVATLAPGHGGSLVVGPSGIGKSALVQAAAEQESGNFHVIRIRGSVVARETPYGALAWLISELPEGITGRPLQLLQQLTALLARRAQGRRILLILDNAEHLDDFTAMVVSQLVRRSAAVVLATAENLSGSATEFLALWTEGQLHRIDLEPLDVPQTRQLMEALLTGRVSHDAARTMQEQTQGNPHFITLMTREQVDEKTLIHSDGTWVQVRPLVYSGPIGEVMTARLQRRRPSERRLIQVLALAGELPLATVLQLVPVSAVENLEEDREVDTTSAMVRLSSPGTAAAIAGSVPMGRSRELWEEVSTILDPGLLEPAALSGFACWTLACGGRLKPELAQEAASLANAAGDPVGALRLVRAVPAARRTQRMALEELCALVSLGQYGEAAHLLELPGILTEAGGNGLWVDLMLHKAALLQKLPEQGSPEAVLQTLATAGGPALTADVLARIVLVRSGVALDDGRIADVPSGLASLRTDPRLSRTIQVQASALYAHLLAVTGRAEESLAALDFLTEIPRMILTSSDLDAVFLRVFQSLLAIGEFRRAEDLVAEMQDSKVKRAFRGTPGELAIGILRALRGEEDAALSALLSSVSQLRLMDPTDMLPLAQSFTAFVYTLQGNQAKARQYDSGIAEFRYPPSRQLIRLSAVVRLLTRLDRPAELIPALLKEAEESLADGMVSSALDALLAAACHGDHAAALKLASVAATAQGTWARTLYCCGAGLAGQDPELLAEAARGAAEVGNHQLCHFAARAALDALPAEQGSALRALARTVRSLERDSFRMLRAANSIEARLATLNPFEADLARRAASQATRSEISGELNLSPRTIDWHLGKIFDKLHVAGRSELSEVLG